MSKAFTCPYCFRSNYDQAELIVHCNTQHFNQKRLVVCPICASMPWGDPKQISINFIEHLNLRHQFKSEEFMDIYLDENEVLAQTLEISKRISQVNSKTRSQIYSDDVKSLNDQSSKFINWSPSSMKKYKADFYAPFFNGNVDTISTKSIELNKSQVELWIASNSFDQGSMRTAYTSLLNNSTNSNQIKTVAKMMKYPFTSLDDYMAIIETQAIAEFLAERFFDYFDGEKFMKFIKLCLVIIKNERYDDKCYFTVEEYLDGIFSKWNDNVGYVNEDIYSNILDAFSHWTFEITNGYLLVHDLQGFKSSDGREYILTDPAISCPTKLSRFGRTNMGFEGIRKFFETHRCNQICRSLHLTRNIYQCRNFDRENDPNGTAMRKF